MITWKLTIEYDGSRYSGWQEQQNARTVAGEIRLAAEKSLGPGVDLQGSGRTDAGVHAYGQVAHMRYAGRRRIAAPQLMRQINDELPYDITVLGLEEASSRFHARHDAKSRTYVYRISTRKRAFEKKYVWWIKEPLNLTAMREAAALIPGRHDFSAFRAKDPSKPHESSIVVVDRAEFEEQEGVLLFRIEAGHFLWRMVRRLTGTLVRAGLGDVTLDDFKLLLANHAPASLDVAAWTAPASGLFLEKVRY